MDRQRDLKSDMSFVALGSLVARHRGRFAFVTLVRVIATMLLAVHPYLLAEMAISIDDPDRAGRYLAWLFLTGVGHFVLWTGCDVAVSMKVNPLSYEFKRIAFTTVWGEGYQRFVDRPSGKVASHVNDLRNHTYALWDSAHYGFLPTVALVPVHIALLWRTAPGNAVAYLAFLAVTGVVLVWVSKPVNQRQRLLTNNTATNSGRVFDSYANFVNVFSFRAHAKEVRRNDRQIDGLIVDDVSASLALTSYWGVASGLIRILLWGGVMGFSWYQFDRGAISFPALVVSVTVLVDFTARYFVLVHFLGEWVDQSARYREAYNYLFPGRDIVADFDLYLGADAEADADGSASGFGSGRARLREGLEMRNVCFSYPDEPDRLVLDDVSFSVGRGERLGVVGRSGEGKSTLIKILLGFYRPTSGEILVDGVPVGPAELAAMQSYVPQDTSLFQETIEYNIGYAEAGPAEPARIRAAAEKANIADFIDDLPEGFHTLVGERGIKLSLGQRQRIAIARAFLKDSDLVILDEATSALDAETEVRVQESLAELWADRAAIVIAHRLATLNDVDRILVIEGGRVIEEGSKAELLTAPGRFAELWGLQRAGLQ